MKRRKFLKNKKGDVAIFALIAVPTLMVIFYGTFTINSCVDIVRKRTQGALDSSLFLLSSKGQSSQIIIGYDEGGNPKYQTICTMSENTLVQETIDLVCPQYIEKINGFNKHWEVWINYKNNANFDSDNPNYYVFKKVDIDSQETSSFDTGWRVCCSNYQRNSELRSTKGIGNIKVDNSLLFKSVSPGEENPAPSSTITMKKYEQDNGYLNFDTEQVFDTVSILLVGKVPNYNIDDYNKYFTEVNPNWSPDAFTTTITAYGTSQCRGTK